MALLVEQRRALAPNYYERALLVERYVQFVASVVSSFVREATRFVIVVLLPCEIVVDLVASQRLVQKLQTGLRVQVRFSSFQTLLMLACELIT